MIFDWLIGGLVALCAVSIAAAFGYVIGYDRGYDQSRVDGVETRMAMLERRLARKEMK